HTMLITLAVGLAGVEQIHAVEPSIKTGEAPFEANQDEYRTPLAGEMCNITLLGKNYAVPGRDRCHTLALTLGGTAFIPALGGSDAIPIAALYWWRETPSSRTRLIFSLFVNELDHALKYERFELLGHLENNTIPFPSTEIEDGKEVKEGSIIWGQAAAWLGVGYRLPVAPFQMDNDLRLQVFYEGGYLYSGRTKDSGRLVSLPPDTYTHGLRLRFRYDGMRRNLMELLHEGVAAGLDTEWGRREKWSDANYGGLSLSKDDTQEFVKISGYLIGAMPVPWLSERNRFLISFHGGTEAMGVLDRFSLFRIGGGPFSTETDDLSRASYPGAMFNQFPASNYMIGTAEYRREFLPFLYLHLRGTLAWADRDLLTSPLSVENDADLGKAFSVGITSGFPWESAIYLEYSHDDGFLRHGQPGDNVLMLWSKGF
ncbi:MAG: hypothetical protein H7X83_09015, partial [Verrucomicrobia bacterium]|nr:hypothetical protein [Deltaproteobacteria bacterium]